MTNYSTIIAITMKAEQALSGVSRATVYSGWSSSNSNYRLTVPMGAPSMKLGEPTIMVTTRDPGHPIGSVGDRTVKVKFVYIDHTT